jgi:phospholipase C
MARKFGLRTYCAQLMVAFAALCTASCGGGSATAPIPQQAPAPSPPDHHGSTVIKHIVVMIQENRSFDDLFATFPNAYGATQGRIKSGSGYSYIALKQVDLSERCDFGHGYAGFLRNYDGGKMDGFVLNGNKCSGNHTAAYQYVNPSEIQPYWTMAQQYALGDQMFQTQGSASFTAHQDLIAGSTLIDQPSDTESIVDFPTSSPWGCDAPSGTVTSYLKWTGSTIEMKYNKGPSPCFTYATMRDLLDAKSVSWKFYTPLINTPGGIWNAFDAIKAVRYGPEWTKNVISPETNVLKDISKGHLPAVSWIIPDRNNSDHPQSPAYNGPSWVASVVNAIGESSYWKSTAIVIVWDDWGGFYDNYAPPSFDHWGGLGFRVPMIVVSPYAREAQKGQPGYISHTQYEFGSILRFMEDTFDLGSLHTTDQRATSISDCFDFTQAPRKFEQIPSSHTESFFLHERSSRLPVDTE